MKPTGNLIVDTICRTAELGVTITGACDAGTHTIIEAEALDVINECPKCQQPGVFRDHRVRTLTDLPVAGYPTQLRIRLPRYRCVNASCRRWIFQAGLGCAADGATTTNRVTRWILQRMVIDRMSVTACARALGIGWDLTNDLALSAVYEIIYSDPHRLEGVKVIGVDKHRWSHNRRKHKDGYVTVIVDMTGHRGPDSTATSPARLLDVVAGRSAEVLKTWLYQQPKQFREGIKIIAMDGFQGYATAANEVIPQATHVMDPFHVVRRAGEKVTKCRTRLQQETTGRRGRAQDPLYRHRKSLLTTKYYLTDRQREALDNLFDYDQDYAPLQQTWLYYQHIIDCYRDSNKRRAKKVMATLIDTLAKLQNTGLEEIAQLGRTMAKRKAD